MEKLKQIKNILKSDSLPKVLEGLHELYKDIDNSQVEHLSASVVDTQFLKDIENLPENIRIFFGKTLRDIKCTISDSDSRKHDLYLEYDVHKKYKIVAVDLPFSSFNKQVFNSIEEVVNAFLIEIKDLHNYFFELENIDRNCFVMEPIKPVYKDDFRNIRIDDKTWLHVEVTPDGSATNVHLIGQSEMWQERLQKGLLNWDQDKTIVDNIMSIFELSNDMSSLTLASRLPEKVLSEDISTPTCAICFCVELPDNPGLPQPLCQNTNCDTHYHKSCLFQWLVACDGGRPPSFGVISGNCPTCLQPISCNEKN